MLRALTNVRSVLWRGVARLSKAAEEPTASAAHPDADPDAALPNIDEPVDDDGMAIVDEAASQRLPYSREAIAKLKLDEYPFYVEREWWKRGARMTFWATWRQLRDVKRREAIVETGADRMRLKALRHNNILPQALRDEAYETLHAFPKYTHPSLVLNMCMFTARQRGKIKPYRVNRHIWRRLADHGQLSGVQRAMW